MQPPLTALATTIGMTMGILFVAASTFAGTSPRLIYNPSDSAPLGFYLVVHPVDVHVGDYVIAQLPAAAAEVAAQRGYLPRSVPVLKQIAATGGQFVCVRDGTVFIDAIAVADVLDRDGRHRPMHAWDQCRRLAEREVFLLNPASPASFDSRYFGPVDVSFLRGRATKW